MKVYAPVPTGSGVDVLHSSLEASIQGYKVRRYSPWWTLFPPALVGFSSRRADLIHASADYGFFFKRSGLPLVVTAHNYTSDRFMRDYSSRLQYLHYRTDLRWFSSITFERATVVVAISRFIADLTRRELQKNPPLRLIYNGIDHTRFVPSVARLTSPPFRVLFCGNLNRRKRAQLLPPLAAALGDKFEIYYTAGLSGRSIDLSGAGGNVLRPLGRIEYEDMPAVYQSMDALFMPSVREGFGLCVAEAMACGLPVVACRESAMPELVEAGSGGMLCPIDDVACYADAIRQLAEDPLSARRMGEFNRARAEQLLTRERMVGEYHRLFEAVLDGQFNR